MSKRQKSRIVRLLRTIATELKSEKVAKTYTIGSYEISIPPKYNLPIFQKNYKLYDRFLPVLAKHISGDKLIIDVGANIGDTAIAMLQNCTNPILCIEPSDFFFEYLDNNLNRLSPDHLSRVRTVKKFVGTGSLTGTLNHTIGGTATLKVAEDASTITHTSLDSLVDDMSDIILVKVDTDGFDFDVIRSADQILSNSQPILFWENEILEDFQLNGFDELYNLLDEKGYRHIYLFDNFGNLITVETSFSTLRNINAYIDSMRKYNSTRTIFYTDVLASTEKYHTLLQQAMVEYREEWIHK